MEMKDIEEYIGKRVFFTLKNGFRYKILLKREYFHGNIINFKDNQDKSVTIDIDELNFIIISNN